jgi:hypothetical protein
MFLLGFKATFQSTHLTPKGPYCIEITNIPLALYIAHIKHASFPLESKVCISYYLNVTKSNAFEGLLTTSVRQLNGK